MANPSTIEHAAQSYGVAELIAQSGPVAKAVLFVLLFASVFSWAVIFLKWRVFSSSLKENKAFLDVFWNGKNLDEIYDRSVNFAKSPVASVFRSGFKELKKLSASERTDDGLPEVDNIGRALARASQQELTVLERYVSWLATTASAAPFIGLFGTVWGIMNSFRSIGATGNANLAVVAPGISEALITTATGLVAAVPAVIAYNWFLNHIRRSAVEMDGFSHDFLNIVQRSFITSRKKAPEA